MSWHRQCSAVLPHPVVTASNKVNSGSAAHRSKVLNEITQSLIFQKVIFKLHVSQFTSITFKIT